MEKIKINCKACGAEKEITPKPEPKNGREKAEILFICRACGSANLRNGTAKLIKKPKKTENQPNNEPKNKPIKTERSIKNGTDNEETRQTAEAENKPGFGFF